MDHTGWLQSLTTQFGNVVVKPRGRQILYWFQSNYSLLLIAFLCQLTYFKRKLVFTVLWSTSCWFSPVRLRVYSSGHYLPRTARFETNVAFLGLEKGFEAVWHAFATKDCNIIEPSGYTMCLSACSDSRFTERILILVLELRLNWTTIAGALHVVLQSCVRLVRNSLYTCQPKPEVLQTET